MAGLLLEGQRIAGVRTISGVEIAAPNVILTVGTFLAGRIHVGLDNYRGGRAGDPPSTDLAAQLREVAPRTARLKTGTPPRIDGRTIDYSALREQHSDDPMPVFSFLGRASEHPRGLRLLAHVHGKNRGRRPALLPLGGR